MRIFLFVFVFILLTGCSQNNNNEDLEGISTFDVYGDIKSDIKRISDLKFSFYNTPNDSLYAFLRDVFVLSDNRDEFLYIAMYYANTKKSTEACMDVFHHLNRYDNPVFRKLAKYYLLLAHELGDKEPEYHLKDWFGDSIPSSVDYWSNHEE